MDMLRIIMDVIRPGSPEFKAHLSQLKRDESRLVVALHLLESPGTEQLLSASKGAAEFP